MHKGKVLHVTTVDMSLELLLGPQLQAMVQEGYEVLGVSAQGSYVDSIEARGVRHIPMFSSTRSFSLYSDIKAAAEFYSIVKREKPDIVHTHNPKPGIYGRIVSKLAGVKGTVNTVHGLYATEEDSFVKRFVVYSLEFIASCFSDIELVQSPEDIITLQKIRVSKKKLRLLGNGVKLERFLASSVSVKARQRLRSEFGFTEQDVVVGTVGRLVLEKGYKEIFEVADKLAESGHSAKILVIGPDENGKSDGLTPELVSKAKADGVVFLGHRDDVHDLYHAMDVFVLASYREGFPRSAMEAATAGLPLVLTDIRGCREVVEHEYNGLLVPKQNSDELYTAIEKLVLDEKLRVTYGANSVQKAKSEFDDQTQINRTLDAYTELLSRN